MHTRGSTALLLPLLPLLPLLLGACGGTSATSCDFRSRGAQYNYCQDYSGQPEFIAPYKVACTQAGGTWSDSASCPATDKLGGCTTSAGGNTLTNWFYSGAGVTLTVAEVMQSCIMSTSSTYVAP
jgi:hypothetical protein